MDTPIATEIWNQITHYISSLDWAYIITFIIIAYGFNHNKVSSGIKKVTQVKTSKKYRTAFIGLLYGVALYFIRGYTLNSIEILLQSFVFSVVFHKFIIDGLVKFLDRKFNTSAKQPYDPSNIPNSNEMV